MDLLPVDIFKLILYYCRNTLCFAVSRKWNANFGLIHKDRGMSITVITTISVYEWCERHVGFPNYFRLTPLVWVIENGTEDLIEYLVSKRNFAVGYECFVAAVSYSRSDILWILDSRFETNPENTIHKKRFLHHCHIGLLFKKGDPGTLDWLKKKEIPLLGNLEFCFRFDYLNSVRWYYKNYYNNFMALEPIKLAIIYGSKNILIWLLTEIKMPSMVRRAPLTAARVGILAMLEFILSLGCVLTTEVLYIAAKRKAIDIVKFCIEKDIKYKPSILKSLLGEEHFLDTDTDEEVDRITRINEIISKFHIWLCSRDENYRVYYMKSHFRCV